MRFKKGHVILRVFLGVLAFVCCYPIIFLLTGAFMGQGEAAENLRPVFAGGEGFAAWSLIPFQPTFRSCVELIFDTPDFFVMFWNSMKITGGILAGQALFGIPAAWGFARYRFRFHRGLFFLYIAMMMMPFQVMMLSDYLVIKQMNLMDTMGAILLPGIFSTLPVFIICQFFKEIPEELLEAARIDGAGEGDIFFSGSDCPSERPGSFRQWCCSFWNAGICWSSQWHFSRRRPCGRCPCFSPRSQRRRRGLLLRHRFLRCFLQSGYSWPDMNFWSRGSRGTIHGEVHLRGGIRDDEARSFLLPAVRRGIRTGQVPEQAYFGIKARSDT